MPCLFAEHDGSVRSKANQARVLKFKIYEKVSVILLLLNLLHPVRLRMDAIIFDIDDNPATEVLR
jgi:hypothetical protein